MTYIKKIKHVIQLGTGWILTVIGIHFKYFIIWLILILSWDAGRIEISISVFWRALIFGWKLGSAKIM